MGRCPPIQPHHLRQSLEGHSHTPASHSPHTPTRPEGWQKGIRVENVLPLENKAVVPWRLGPNLKATNSVAPENSVLTGPQFLHLR